MNTQHTPGPWHVNDDGHIDSAFGAIAEIVGVDNPDDETKPNANLIAAAPDLLRELDKARAALKEQLEILIQSHTCPTTGLITDDADLLAIESDQDLINSIDAAIAKATEVA